MKFWGDDFEEKFYDLNRRGRKVRGYHLGEAAQLPLQEFLKERNRWVHCHRNEEGRELQGPAVWGGGRNSMGRLQTAFSSLPMKVGEGKELGK